MKKLLMLLMLAALLGASCTLTETPAPVPPPAPAPQTPAQAPESPAQPQTSGEAEKPEEPELVLTEGDVEVMQGADFDAVSLIKSGNYEDIQFSSIDTNVPGEQELTITVKLGGITKEYKKKVIVIRPETKLEYTMVTEGPVFLIHPDKLTGDESEDAYKSFYEYPVFSSEPADVAEKMNKVIMENHLWGVAESFKTMSNSISPDYDYNRLDILQAKTKVSEGKEAVVVHTDLKLALYQSSYGGTSAIVTIFDKGTGLPISSQQLLERYGMTPEKLVDRLNTFLVTQPNTTAKFPELPPYQAGMAQEEMRDYYDQLMELTWSEEYDKIFLERDLTPADLEGKVYFVEDGKLYCEFVFFRNVEAVVVWTELVEVASLE